MDIGGIILLRTKCIRQCINKIPILCTICTIRISVMVCHGFNTTHTNIRTVNMDWQNFIAASIRKCVRFRAFRIHQTRNIITTIGRNRQFRHLNVVGISPQSGITSAVLVLVGISHRTGGAVFHHSINLRIPNWRQRSSTTSILHLWQGRSSSV